MPRCSDKLPPDLCELGCLFLFGVLCENAGANFFLARSVSEGDHANDSASRKRPRQAEVDGELKVSPLFGNQRVIVVPLADASG